jgi:rare lipoprotein A
MSQGVVQLPDRWNWLATVLALTLICMALSGCGSRYVPGIGAPPPPPKKSPPPAPTGKGGTYKPYTVLGQTYYPLGSAEGYSETGVASWYGPNFHGKKTANGERYDMYQMTAAHRILPMHTRLMVRNLDNGRTAEVRVNDRGPFVGNRVIDLSYAAANLLGVVGPGTARVSLQTIPGERIQYVGPFYVQYGAFVVEENAKRLRSRLVARGFTGTRIAKGELDGTTFWRVQVGAFSSLGEAESTRIRLAKESPGCFIIAD